MESGLALYNIESDGCLNGVYTNDDLEGEIFNEIAKINTNLGADDISGIYNSIYFDKNNSRNEAELNICLKKGTEKIYTFSWEIDKKIVFEGIGYRMNEKQIAAHYWKK